MQQRAIVVTALPHQYITSYAPHQARYAALPETEMMSQCSPGYQPLCGVPQPKLEQQLPSHQSKDTMAYDYQSTMQQQPVSAQPEPHGSHQAADASYICESPVSLEPGSDVSHAAASQVLQHVSYATHMMMIIDSCKQDQMTQSSCAQQQVLYNRPRALALSQTPLDSKDHNHQPV